MRSNLNIANDLIRKYKIGAKQARYREDGIWYHPLISFPAAYLDRNGYILFNTEEEYLRCEYLLRAKDVHVRPPGISSIPGYAKFSEDNSVLIRDRSRLLQSPTSLKDEFAEGGTHEIVVELARRDSALKRRAIERYGLTCKICGFNFQHFYGALGEGYIEIHHLRPLSASKGSRITTLKDVTVVCANCHRILHKNGKEPFSIEALRSIIQK